jgi:TolB-like protein/Tfp pilus assembly protein PilF
MAQHTVQRRLAAILAADVVGYSRLVEADDEGTLAALKTRRREVLEPVVARHQGRVFKVSGDGVLVEFASAVHALRCAIELQRAMAAANGELAEDRRIVLRIGVNLGDVMVENSDLYGDGVNIAARLEGIAEPGGILVSGSAYDQVKNKIDTSLEDLGRQNLKNIAEPVRVYRALAAASPALGKASSPLKPSIAVLPFQNMSGEAEQEYFSDGITEDIITELFRFRSLLVIARNSSFAYKGKATSITNIARELDVQYVIEGSVRRSGQHVRVTAQLIEAASGIHIWAERYDRELADIFSVQEEIASSIAGTLVVELEEDSLKQARHKPPQNLRAYEHWLQGMRLINSQSESSEARKHFETAIAADPTYARGYAGLAETQAFDAVSFALPQGSLVEAWQQAFCNARKAIALDDTDYQGLVTLAWCHLYRHEWDLVRKHLDRAIALTPNAADLLANASYFFAALGDAERGIRLGQTALKLNPHHPDWYLGFLGVAVFTARQYAEALEIRLRAADAFIDSPFFAAATLAHMDRVEEARHWAKIAVAGLARTPGGAPVVASGQVVQALVDNNPYYRQVDRDHFAEGMRRAGVPG